MIQKSNVIPFKQVAVPVNPTVSNITQGNTVRQTAQIGQGVLPRTLLTIVYQDLLNQCRNFNNGNVNQIKHLGLTHNISSFSKEKAEIFTHLTYASLLAYGNRDIYSVIDMNAGMGTYLNLPGSPYISGNLLMASNIPQKNLLLFENDNRVLQKLQLVMQGFNNNQINLNHCGDHKSLITRNFLISNSNLLNNACGFLMSDHQGHPPVDIINTFFNRTSLNLRDVDMFMSFQMGRFKFLRSASEGKQGCIKNEEYGHFEYDTKNILGINKDYILVSEKARVKKIGWRFIIATNNKYFADLVTYLLKDNFPVKNIRGDNSFVREVFMNSEERATNLDYGYYIC
jgi:hypothetical protein